MKFESTDKLASPFETIHFDIVERLDREAEERTIRPQQVDWTEIHQQADIHQQAEQVRKTS